MSVKKDPILTCLRQVPPNKRGALIMAMSNTHAREVVADMKRRGYAATQCGKFVTTNAPFRASKVKK
jgi:hydrogenase maturation factor